MSYRLKPQTIIEWFLLRVPGCRERVLEILGFDPSGSGVPVGAATETSPGIAEIATEAETLAFTDDERFVTPLKLGAAIVASTSEAQIRAIVETGTPGITVDRNTTGANLTPSSGGTGIVLITADSPVFTAKAYAYGGGSFYGASDYRVEVVKLSTTVIRLNIVNAATGALTAAGLSAPLLVDILA